MMSEAGWHRDPSMGACYGRGPLQLSWNFNYQDTQSLFNFSHSIVTNPKNVFVNAKTSWMTAFRTFSINQSGSSATCANRGYFGGVTFKINGQFECIGRDPASQERLNYYYDLVRDLKLSASSTQLKGDATCHTASEWYFYCGGCGARDPNEVADDSDCQF